MKQAIKNLCGSLILATLMSNFGAAEPQVALNSHIPKETAASTKLGPVREAEVIQLGLVVRLDEALLKQAMDQLYGAHAAKPKHFLSSSEFALKFGLAAKREKLKNFARAQGLTVDPAADLPGSMIVKVSGRSNLVEKAFSLKLNRYRTPDGREFRSHETEPRVPASLLPHLSAVTGLSNLTGVAHPYLRASPISRSPAVKPGAASKASVHPSLSGGTGFGGALAPADIKTIYSLNQTPLTGSGQTVAVFELDGYNPPNSAAYESAFNLAQPPVTFVGVDGTTNLCGGQSCSTQSPYNDEAMIEVALDVEMVAALAPGVSQILVYDNLNTWQGALDEYNQIAVDNIANVVSTSWGAPEPAGGVAFIQSESQVFQRMALQGQSIYAASGDSGAYADGLDLSVQDPSSQPYVTGVGGTSLSGSVQSYTETVWSGSGGGISQYWPIPGYQIGTPTLASQQYRNVPDVALNADPGSGYAVFVGGSWWQVGGTSAAAPLWAGLTALVNQQRLSAGSGVFGFANPNLYLLGTNNANQVAYKDITSGNNGYYSAGPGYDNATGWGSYIGSAMINAGSQQFPTVLISTPVTGQGLPGVVSIDGTAASAAFSSYKVEYASSASSSTFQLIGSVHTSPVTNGLLETWNTTTLPVGIYSLRLTLTDAANLKYSATVSPLYIDRAPPTVAFSAPNEGATFTSGQAVSIQATASDDVGVQSVTFLDNGSLIAQVLNPPYLITPNLLGTGIHTLSAVARDFVGNTATATVHVTLVPDTTPPTPPTTVSVIPYDSMEIEVSWSGATDNVAVAGYRLDVSTDSQFGSFVPGFQNLDIGNYTPWYISGLTPATNYYVRIRAYDAAGNVSVNSPTAQGTTLPPSPPYILITNPAYGATAFGREQIDVYTYSQSSLIQRVDYLVDGQASASMSTYPYTYYWDTTAVPNGSHQISAIAYDVTGASTPTSIPVTVTNLSLFQDNFNSGSFSSWTVVDDGNISAPSNWQVVNGALTQTSPIHGNDVTLRLGTQVITGGPSWTDYSLSLHLTPTNGDAGVIFRRKDNNNYYRFSMSSDGYLYLVEILNGTVGFLENYPMPYVPGQQYSVTIDVKSYMLRVFVNGQALLGANNASFSSGGIGLYAYNTTGASFDDVQVLSSSVPDMIPPVVQIASPANGSTLSGLVTISGTASDNVGVQSVTLSADGQTLGLAAGTTTWSYALDSTLLSNGPHTLTAQAVDFSNNTSSAASIQVTVTNVGLASYDPTLKAPLCAAPGAVCDSGGLLNGRDSLVTGPEPNQPNTIYNSCADGTFGVYHQDESNDRLKISTLDGQPFAPGKTVQVAATVWAYSYFAGDALDLYYTATASSPTWTYLTTIVPSAPGAQVLSTTFTLPPGSLQAIRATFRYAGSPAPCTTGSYDDHDDLVFAVAAGSPTAPNPPTQVAFTTATFNSLILSWSASTGPVGAVDYHVDVSTDSLFGSFVENYHDFDAGNAPAGLVIIGLQPSTTYYARARAYDALGDASINSLTAAGVTSPPPMPNLAVYPSTLSFTATASGGDPALQTLQVTNTGGANSIWTATSDASWLAVLPSTGTSPASIGSQLVSVTAAAGSLGAGTYTGHLTFTDQTGVPNIVTVTFTLAPARPSCGQVGTNAFFGCYYDDTGHAPGSFTNLVTTTTDSTINFNWNGAPPEPGLQGTLFSVHWMGNFTFTGGPTTFSVVTDDGMRLWVDGALVIDAWYDQPPTPHSNTITLTPGTHLVNVDYYQDQGGATAQVAWAQAAGPGASATFLNLDTATQGSWKGVYGTEGETIEADSTNYPAYAQVTLAGNATYTWASSTPDNRALQKYASTTDRLAACWYSGSNFTIDVNLTDGATHQMALYVLDWDNYGAGGRSQRMDVTDAATGTLLDSRTATSFQNGQYYVWSLQGHVKVTITNLNSNAVVSGIFFGVGAPPPPSASAVFIKTDTTTEGSWNGAYGIDGEAIEADSTNYPAYAQVTLAGNATYTWASSTPDNRALQKYASTTDRLAACWYSGSNFTMDINLTDGQPHPVALYLLDWDNYGGGRSERIDLADAATGTLLDSRSVTNFQNGQYYVWNLRGHIKATITNLNSNAVVSGIFFGGTGSNPSVVTGFATVQSSEVAVRVHPDPFRASRGDTSIIFDQMSLNSTVKIFTVSGRWVKTLQAPSGSVSWDLTNDSGDKVASGLYLYLATDSQSNKVHGKFAIIR